MGSAYHHRAFNGDFSMFSFASLLFFFFKWFCACREDSFTTFFFVIPALSIDIRITFYVCAAAIPMYFTITIHILEQYFTCKIFLPGDRIFEYLTWFDMLFSVCFRIIFLLSLGISEIVVDVRGKNEMELVTKGRQYRLTCCCNWHNGLAENCVLFAVKV